MMMQGAEADGTSAKYSETVVVTGEKETSDASP